MSTIAKATTMGRVQAATRIVFGHFYVAAGDDFGFAVFDARNPDGRALLADEMPFEKAIEYAHQRYLDEEYHQS